VLDSPQHFGDAARMSPLLPESLVPAFAQPPLVALVIALVLGLAAALAGRPRLAGVAAALGLTAALFLVYGVRMVTPRMLPERMPWLVLAAGLGGMVGELLGGRAMLAAGLGALTAFGGTWFMLGAPREMADLARVAAEAGPVLAGFAVPLWRLVATRASSASAGFGLTGAGLLAAGLWAGGSAAVFPGLAASAGAAALGLLLAGAVRGAAAGLAGSLALGAAMGGVVAAAGLAQRGLPIWAGCLAPLAGLALGPRAAGLLALAPGSAVASLAGPVLAGGPLVAAAWLLASGR
jgi:hypothetical protein